MKHLIVVLALILVPALAVADGQSAEKRVVATVGADGIQRVSLTGGGYYFDPNVIVVKVNVPVELTVTKESGVTPHNIELKAPEAGMDFKESLSTTPKVIKFTPTKTGTYPFECTERFLFFKSHKDRGMHGMLEVVEATKGTGDNMQSSDRPSTDQSSTATP